MTDAPNLHAGSDQIARERQMAEQGVARYRRMVDRCLEGGRLSRTPPGRRLIQSAIDDLPAEIKGWVHGATARPGAVPQG